MKTPALDAWRRELAAGERTRTTFDALWRAACEEANALEAAAAGLPQLAQGFQQEAYRIITAAAKRRRGAA
jgi:hypothetical protein